MCLGSTLSNIWHRFQGELFPALAQEVDPLFETHKCFVTVLDLVKAECFVVHGGYRRSDHRRLKVAPRPVERLRPTTGRTVGMAAKRDATGSDAPAMRSGAMATLEKS